MPLVSYFFNHTQCCTVSIFIHETPHIVFKMAAAVRLFEELENNSIYREKKDLERYWSFPCLALPVSLPCPALGKERHRKRHQERKWARKQAGHGNRPGKETGRARKGKARKRIGNRRGK